jgi:Flp pilus assembly protein TadG
MLAFGVVGVGRVTRAQLGLAAVSREAARAGALAGTSADALALGTSEGQAVAAGYGLTNGSLRLVIDATGFGRGGQVRASAQYDVALDDLPLMGWLRVPLASTHAEYVDPYRSRW